MIDRAALREAVKQHVEQYDTPHDDDPRRRYTKAQMEIAIAVALEEAAKVAEAFPARTHRNLATAPYAVAEQAGDEIAAAIRAMMGKD